MDLHGVVVSMGNVTKVLPVAGTLLVPLIVPQLMMRLGIAYGLAFAVVVVTVWLAVLISRAEMPGHG